MNKLLVIPLIILSTTIFAQDQVAEDIINKLNTTTKAYENMTIEFVFTLENKSQNIKESQQGSLVVAGEKFQLTMNKQIIINNGESQWVYLADINEVQIMEHDPEDNMISPSKLFTISEEDYKYRYVGAHSENGKRLQSIDLFPKESQEFMKINIAIDAAKNQLNRITMHDKNGGTYTYLVNSFESNTIIKPFIFDSTEFPGAEIIDLR